MQFPQLNINGTSQTALIEQYESTAAAMVKAIDALRNAAPHGRDYQTLPAGAYMQAKKEHDARIAALQSVYDDLMDIVINVSEQRR